MTSLDFDKKWASYVLAGGAVLGLPAVTHAGPIQLFSGDSTGVVSQGLDIDGDGVTDVTFFANGTPGSRDTYATGAGSNQISMFFTPFGEINAYGPGQVIDSSATYAPSGSFLYDKTKMTTTIQKGKWANDINQTSYMGLQFLIGSDIHYGWAAVSVQLGSATLDVTDWGYNPTANAAVTTPGTALPEPSSMALMLLGAAGVSALKLRRKSSQK